MSLEDYYRNVVKLNEQNGGWAQYTYGILTKVINDNNYKKIAEIGIGYGTHAKYLLQTTNLETIYLIDPMKIYDHTDRFVIDIMNQVPKQSGNQFNELYELIQKELEPWKDRIQWIRKESLQVQIKDIPDGSLDCVYIDGDHTYNAVLKDLHFWTKKIRSGGQLLGDDYWMTDVANAVHQFSKDTGKPFDLLTKENNDYKVFRFYV